LDFLAILSSIFSRWRLSDIYVYIRVVSRVGGISTVHFLSMTKHQDKKGSNDFFDYSKEFGNTPYMFWKCKSMLQANGYNETNDRLPL
jgi:hypothetical protein